MRKTIGIVVVAALAAKTTSGPPAGDDHRDRSAGKLGGQYRQAIALILRPPVQDRDVLALDVTGAPEPLAKYAQSVGQDVRGPTIEKPDHRHRQRLRPRRERPRRRRTTKQRDELAPGAHSITSSARVRSDGGTAIPSVFAV